MFDHVPPARDIVMYSLAFMLAITIHEFAHARAALSAGDDTAKLKGRISLNPLDHLDPVGTILFLVTMLTGFGIAWGKPVPVNPSRFKNPRWDDIKVSLWGPLSNLLMAVALALPLRSDAVVHALGQTYTELVAVCVQFNLMLAIFNLIPVPPLDGSHIMARLLPIDAGRAYDSTMRSYGMIILVALMMTGTLTAIIEPPIAFLSRLLLL